MVEWFVNDIAGIVCSSMTYVLVLYSQFVVITVILLPDPLVSTAIQVLLYLVSYNPNISNLILLLC